MELSTCRQKPGFGMPRHNYIFKTRYLEGCYTDTFSMYTYIGVDILNILLLDLDRHSHPPFLKMAAVLVNVAISYLES